MKIREARLYSTALLLVLERCATQQVSGNITWADVSCESAFIRALDSTACILHLSIYASVL